MTSKKLFDFNSFPFLLVVQRSPAPRHSSKNMKTFNDINMQACKLIACLQSSHHNTFCRNSCRKKMYYNSRNTITSKESIFKTKILRLLTWVQFVQFNSGGPEDNANAATARVSVRPKDNKNKIWDQLFDRFPCATSV